MGFISNLKKLRDAYVINQVHRLNIPPFEPSSVVRQRIVFSGRVQKVGFRLAVYTLAKRLNLTGWVKNRDDKKVEAELQGEEEKIVYLIGFLKSLKRASVKNIEIVNLPLVEEQDFSLVK